MPQPVVAPGVVTAQPVQPLDVVVGTAEGESAAVEERVVVPPHDLRHLGRHPLLVHVVEPHPHVTAEIVEVHVRVGGVRQGTFAHAIPRE